MKVIYTYTDEAPALATHSFLPVVEAFAAAAGVEVETRDISLSGRILAAFGLVPDALGELGAAGHHPRGQHHQAAEHQRVDPAAQGGGRRAAGRGPRGARLPGEPADRRREGRPRGVRRGKGSAVNPVLREGNSDRRAPASVKQFARNHPHSMGAWSPESASHVATMSDGDFRHSETSFTAAAADHPAHRARRRRRHRHRAQAVAAGPRGRDRRRRGDAPRRARRVPRRAGRRRQGARRAVLGAPQGHDDEGERPDPVRTGGGRLLRRRLRAVRRRPRARRRQPQRRAGQHPHRPRQAARRQARGHREGDRRHLRVRPGAGHGRLRPRASPTCTSRPT